MFCLTYSVGQDYDIFGALNQDYESDESQSGGQDSSEDVEDQMKKLASLLQSKMKSEGGFKLPELKTMFVQSGLNLSPNIVKFNELDTNKNGILEESEVNSDYKGDGEDYDNYDESDEYME